MTPAEAASLGASWGKDGAHASPICSGLAEVARDRGLWPAFLDGVEAAGGDVKRARSLLKVYSFGQGGLSSGRMTSREPNLQNIPRRTETGRKLRELWAKEAPEFATGDKVPGETPDHSLRHIDRAPGFSFYRQAQEAANRAQWLAFAAFFDPYGPRT